MTSLNIGVLGFQGSVEEHLAHLEKIPGVTASAVKNINQLYSIDGLILPGGESTTLVKLLSLYDMMQPIQEAVRGGMPIWGTCAGTILLAREITNSPNAHLGLMDITVCRNAYGTQLDSFATKAVLPDVCLEEIPLVFIRAPIIESVGSKVTILGKVEDKIVAAREGNILATTFHPELTDDLNFHRYFVDIAIRARR